MFKNFIQNNPSESKLINYSLSLMPEDLSSKTQFMTKMAPKRKSVRSERLVLILATRKEMDQVFNLPGLTFSITFDQYSGYLKGKDPQNYLHYWLVEAQTDAKNAPLVLWLTGGPDKAFNTK
jgi:carboxypeptidase C (cathepsin A)